MSPLPSGDPVAALNQVLSEVIDVVLDVRQARRRVPGTHALHAVLDQLSGDLRAWARLLMDEDLALGVPPLASMPSASSRTPPSRWAGTVSDEDARQVIAGHLDRLGQHVTTALAEQDQDRTRAALTEVQRGLLAHRQALSEL